MFEGVASKARTWRSKGTSTVVSCLTVATTPCVLPSLLYWSVSSKFSSRSMAFLFLLVLDSVRDL